MSKRITDEEGKQLVATARANGLVVEERGLALANPQTSKPRSVAVNAQSSQDRESHQRKAEVEKARSIFVATAIAHGLPEPTPEYRFDLTRRWRFDWMFRKPEKFRRDLHSWVLPGVAVEIQGGLHNRGRHTRGAALVDEYEKLTAAQIQGWIVLLVTPKQVESGEVFGLARRALDW